MNPTPGKEVEKGMETPKKEDFPIELNSTIFTLSLALNKNKIIMSIKEKDSKKNKIYEIALTMTMLLEKSKLFSLYDSIEGAYSNFFLDSFKEKKFKVIFENEEFIFELFNFIPKENNIIFHIPLKYLDTNSALSKISSTIKEMKKELIETKAELKEIKNNLTKYLKKKMKRKNCSKKFIWN